MRPRPEPRLLGPSSIQAGEVLTLAEAARRLNWGPRMVSQAQRDGLRTILYGRVKYTTGQWVAEFFATLAERQGNGNGLTPLVEKKEW